MDKLLWLQHHWIVLLVGVIAADNVLIAFCQGAGLTKAGTILARLGQGLKAALDAIMRNKNVPPAAGGAAACIMICLMAGNVIADVSINDVLSKAGAKEGVMYSVNAKRGLNFLAATIATQGNFSLVGGLVSTDGIGAAVDYNVGAALPKVSFPVMSLVNELHIGVGGYVRTLTTSSNSDQAGKDDNKWGWGPTAFIKWSF